MEDHVPRFFEVAQLAAAADRDVVDMVSGEPDWAPPAAIRTGLEAYAEEPVDRFQYPPCEGLWPLREEIAARRGVEPESVYVTNGTGEANYLAMAAALEETDGSTVVAVDPVYPYYPAKTRLLGATPELVPTDPDGRPPVDAIAEAVDEDTAAIVVNTPNNPTGAVYDADAMARLATIAEDAGAVLVSDEVYDHFDYSGEFASGRSLDTDRCIVTNAFSKSMAITGFRIGYAIVPPAYRDAVRRHHLLINVTGSRPAQAAVLEALRETPASYYRENRQLLADRIRTFTDALAGLDVPHSRPDGGFYVMARLPDRPGTMDTIEELITEAGVAAMPGGRFGSAAGDWIRFSLTTPRVAEAANRLETHLG